jgi:hypothetical protein
MKKLLDWLQTVYVDQGVYPTLAALIVVVLLIVVTLLALDVQVADFMAWFGAF